jgi:hypothetical protein
MFNYIKFIKTFENSENNNFPEVGDYVIFNTNYTNDEQFIRLSNFLNNNLGIIDKIYMPNYGEKYRADVKYDNIPEDLKLSFRKDGTIDTILDKIYAYGKTPEEVEMKVKSKKYNL